MKNYFSRKKIFLCKTCFNTELFLLLKHKNNKFLKKIWISFSVKRPKFFPFSGMNCKKWKNGKRVRNIRKMENTQVFKIFDDRLWKILIDHVTSLIKRSKWKLTSTFLNRIWSFLVSFLLGCRENLLQRFLLLFCQISAEHREPAGILLG